MNFYVKAEERGGLNLMHITVCVNIILVHSDKSKRFQFKDISTPVEIGKGGNCVQYLYINTKKCFIFP